MDINFDELKGLTLAEAVRKVPVDTVMSIGARSAFLFIGTKIEWRSGRRYVDAELKGILNRRAEGYADAAKTACDSIIAELAGKSPKKAEYMLESLRQKLNTAANAKRKADAFTPLKDRTVLDAYSRINPADGINIRISGDEDGRFWVRSEYVAHRPKMINAAKMEGAEDESTEDKAENGMCGMPEGDGLRSIGEPQRAELSEERLHAVPEMPGELNGDAGGMGLCG